MDELELYFSEAMDENVSVADRVKALKEFVHACVEGGYEDEEGSPGEEGGIALVLGEPKK